ncbi:c-type cytochrome [Paraburkholderia tropica]|uniref:c-type cytochrome n=1 Tax=Paraburkholderia tropica TaxID=92647 RepID=UPI002AB1AC40|nr:c-type cytochrome [Paraburkholderia tropica]
MQSQADQVGNEDSGVQDSRPADVPHTLEAGRFANPPATSYNQSYGWPADDSGRLALLNVRAEITATGELRNYQYRASNGEAPREPRSDAFLPDWQPLAQHAFLYRHAHTSLVLDDSVLHMPAHAHAFARESFIDEAAVYTASDPVALRLRHLDSARDSGAREVVRLVTERAAWGRKALADGQPGWLSGRGFAMDGSAHHADDASAAGPTDTPGWAAWVVDIDVHRQSGDVVIRRVVAGYGEGHDGPPVLNGVPHGLVETAVSRVLGKPVSARPAYDEAPLPGADAATALDLVAGVATPPDLHHTAPALSTLAAERATAPAAAAIANAIFDATGVRFRQPPFDAVSLRSELAATQPPEPVHHGVDAPRQRRLKRLLTGGGIAGFVGGLIGVAAAMFPGPPEIAPIVPGSIDTSTWSAATLERGRQIALQGDCAVCHTAPGGPTNAGGFPLETPFGTIYSTNLTPDPETGIGLWSYPAFERAMRKGISRDGRHLYPAFPYTSFAKMSEPDMLALYAWLMSQAPVNHAPPKTNLPFPMNIRSSVAGWNWLYHDDSEFKPDPTQSALWNRGKYLVDGAGHCGACHTPRNRLGAEIGGLAYLTGGEAEGWDAPPLVGQRGPVPWTESALVQYLRTGFSPEHGVAAGPMAPVVAGLAALPEQDVKAIAHYLASLSPQVDEASALSAAREQSNGADTLSLLSMERGRQTFETACAVCHATSGGVGHLGVRPLMGLNTSVAHAKPDNLLHVMLNGIDSPATAELGYMPAFRDVYDDRQLAELTAYIRARYAPGQPAWHNLEEAAARVRHAAH